jgi:hypothetical protein
MAFVMWLTPGLFFVFRAMLGLAVFGAVAWTMKALGEDEQERLGDMLRRRFRHGNEAPR